MLNRLFNSWGGNMFCPKCGLPKSMCICGYCCDQSNFNFSKKNKYIKTDSNDSKRQSQNDMKENFHSLTLNEDQNKLLNRIIQAITDGYKYIILETNVEISSIAINLANKYKNSFILSENEFLKNKYIKSYDLKYQEQIHFSTHQNIFKFKDFENINLLIFDDAYSIDENIANFFTYTIDIEKFKEKINALDFNVKELEEKNYKDWLDFFKFLQLDDDKIDIVIDSIKENPDNWICSYDNYKYKSLKFQPLNIGNLLKKFLLNKAEICIFISPVILDSEIFTQELGLNNFKVKFIKKLLKGDSNKQQIFLRNNLYLKNYYDNKKFLILIIEDILKKHKNDKGIIDCTRRYKNLINHEINDRRIISIKNYPKNKLNNIDFKEIDNFVFVSDSIDEEMDFKKYNCNFQIIMKEKLLPWNKRAKIKNKENNWYSYKKAFYIVQMLQRINRKSDDNCVSYIIDEPIILSIKNDILNNKFIPRYILDSIVDMDKGYGYVTSNIKKQFGVYYLFDYVKDNKYKNIDSNHKYSESKSLSEKILYYKYYGTEKSERCLGSFNYFNKRLMEAISEISYKFISNQINKIALISVPSSTKERDKFATMRESIKCFSQWYNEGKIKTRFACDKEIVNCSNLLIRTKDVATSHITKKRPSYIEHMNSIECVYDNIFERDDVVFIILDDICTRGTVMDACEDILIKNGASKNHIIKFALFKTLW